MIPTTTLDTLQQCFTALSELGADLSEAEWATITDLPGWTVQDNLSHLIGVERMMEGLPATAHRSSDRDYVRNPIGQANEHEVDVRRGLPGAEVLAEWNSLVEQRIATLRSGDAEYFAQPMMTPTGPGTLADFLHIRVLDCWLHEQDVRRAVSRPGNLSGAAAEHTIDRLIRTIPIVIGKRAGTPEGGAVLLDITGPVPRHLVYEVHEGRAARVDSPANTPLVTITLGSEDFVVLAAGRRRTAQVHASIDGDAALGAAVLDNLNMMV